jgi:hypothetical protein
VDLTTPGYYVLTATVANETPQTDNCGPPMPADGWFQDSPVVVTCTVLVDTPPGLACDCPDPNDVWACCPQAPGGIPYNKCTDMCCHGTVGCPSIDVTAVGAQCALPNGIPAYGGHFEICYRCPDGETFSGWTVEELVREETNPQCTKGYIRVSTIPWRTSCWRDSVIATPGPNEVPCEDRRLQVVYFGPTAETVWMCQYPNTQRIKFEEAQPPHIAKVTTSSFGVTQSCYYDQQ